jgi:predicted RNase H-like nuclease (RuvC/YqgF family)
VCGSEASVSDSEIVDRVAVRIHELEKHLDAFGDRLRAMRRRNHELEEEIGAFEAEIDRLRDWLSGQAAR